VNVAIFGTVTATGRALVEAALDADHTVTVLEPDDATFPYTHERLRIIEGDVFDLPSVEAAIRGADAVVTAFDEPLDQLPGTDRRDAMENVVAVLSRYQASRLVAVVDPPGATGSRGLRGWLAGLLDREADAADREQREALVEVNDVTWTVIQPTGLTDGAATGAYTVGSDVDPDGPPVLRSDLVAFVLDLLEEEAHLQSTITIAGR